MGRASSVGECGIDEIGRENMYIHYILSVLKVEPDSCLVIHWKQSTWLVIVLVSFLFLLDVSAFHYSVPGICHLCLHVCWTAGSFYFSHFASCSCHLCSFGARNSIEDADIWNVSTASNQLQLRIFAALILQAGGGDLLSFVFFQQCHDYWNLHRC